MPTEPTGSWNPRLELRAKVTINYLLRPEASYSLFLRDLECSREEGRFACRRVSACQWNLTEDHAQNRTVYHTMPADAQGFISEWKGKNIDGVFA